MFQQVPQNNPFGSKSSIFNKSIREVAVVNAEILSSKKGDSMNISLSEKMEVYQNPMQLNDCYGQNIYLIYYE